MTSRIRPEAYKLILFFSRNMHLYLYTEDVDKVQYVQAARSLHTITLQEQTDYICYDVKNGY